ncbi:protein FAM167A isoform X2 [Denticeps clupeoides]|nr:protein FAM167A-like isoform X2 [Denticeps clupeoides]
MDIESALAWLRRELIELRSQDQLLIRQLMDLHAGIQELKMEYAEIEGDELEEEEEEEEDWDSGSETELGYHSTMPYLCSTSRASPPSLGSRSKRVYSRRSSVP